MQKAVKCSSHYFYMLKPYNLLTQGFENKRTAQENIFKHMCKFGAREEWWEGIILVSSYLDVETTKYRYYLINPTPLD